MKHDDLHDIRLNFNPLKPQKRFLDMGLKAVSIDKSIPWPKGSEPVSAPLSKIPDETESLEQFNGYDAVIVSWTSAEAATLASLLSPDFPTSKWYEYRYNVKDYIPLVTGKRAPFNDRMAAMKRYYHSLGLYFPCKIGSARVLLFKSGLHLDYDGPATPVRKLMSEIAGTVQPKVFITTGTGGGIGGDVALGDVIIAGETRFDCVTQFKDEAWHEDIYKTTPVSDAVLEAITPDLTSVNASKIPNARPTPKIWSESTDAIVTTDFFGFDDSTNHFKLQGLGRACDMGDAMVGQALQAFPNIKWFAIRNASDPQIPNPTGNIKTAGMAAGKIYSKYGAFTTAASVIASWAVVNALCNTSQVEQEFNKQVKNPKAMKIKNFSKPAKKVSKKKAR